MYIVIVEDDHNQSAWIADRLGERFRSLRIKRIKTEHEFISLLPAFVAEPPDLVIMDVMLRWTDPAPGQPERPQRVRDEGPFKAGIRCQELFSKAKNCENVPVVLYTILEEKDLRKQLGQLSGTFIHLRKDSDPAPLLENVWRFAVRKEQA